MEPSAPRCRPAIRDGTAEAAGAAQENLVDIGGIVIARIRAGNHGVGDAHAERAFGKAETVAEIGEGRLGENDQAVSDIGRRHRAGMRKFRDAGDTALAQMDANAPETPGIMRGVGIDGIKHAGHHVIGRAGFGLVEAAGIIIGILAQIQVDGAGYAIDVAVTCNGTPSGKAG